MLPESARIVNATHRVLVVVASVLALGASAQAHPDSFNPNALDLSSVLDREVPVTPPSLELAIGGGYTQGIGGAGASGSLEDMTGPGGALELQIGARIAPAWSVGLYGTLARFRHGDMSGDGSRAEAATAGVQAVWHGRAAWSVDPWVSVGAGWRALWLTPANAPASTLYGIEALRLQLGIDYRFSRRLAISPVIGASVVVFVAENGAMTNGFTSLDDNRLNFYGFTGLLGRFDFGG